MSRTGTYRIRPRHSEHMPSGRQGIDEPRIRGLERGVALSNTGGG
eukprot:CAMPEP_0180818770 /NCGR_PEP_ID=MMETSP1038_2-20121128/69389_1 /TAXON_ID=632150 /ORGANISM="Azadinium spinosum, Strain 3D9" /LENGTH=44 /DNA_ID= /DNA_START= /DNA_END= /DNA_ORIENTATION=